MLIIVKGTIIEIVFAIARKPIKFDIKSDKIKNNTINIIGERWKYIIVSKFVKSTMVEKSVRKNRQTNKIPIITLNIFPTRIFC